MSIATNVGKKTIWLVNSTINTSLLVVILILLTFAGYAMWDTRQVNQAADATRYEKYKPNLEDESASFEELRAINPEVFAWLTIYGTHIDYPVAHSPDNNLKYVNTDAFGNYSLSGAIFLDSKNNPDFTDFNNILYGHHMEKQTMFGEIGLFAEKSYFNARKYGMLYFDGKEHGIEFFTLSQTDAYNSRVFHANIIGEEAQQEYLDLLYELSLHSHEGVQVTIDDNLVLLSTCSEVTTNGRDILVGRLTDELFSDPFYKEAVAPAPITVINIDHLSELITQMPLWVKLVIVLLLLLLIIGIITIIRTSRKRKRRNMQA